jgi:hypothetical protein
MIQAETLLSASKSVSRKGDVVLRPARPWTPSIHALLKHLERVGFPAAPRLVGSGVGPDGRETLGYIAGQFVHPGRWSDEAVIAVGQLLRDLHAATASFVPAADAVWQPWFLREIGVGRVISHGDFAPWNMVTGSGMPVAVIDWEHAGPVDPLTELARVCWLFPQLHDEDVAERCGLPSPSARTRQVRLLTDAYGASRAQRQGLVERIIEVVVRETAEEAIEAEVTPESHGPLWGLAWRARAAGWILRHRALLERSLG